MSYEHFEHPWYLYDLIVSEPDANLELAKKIAIVELDLLKKQKCAWCSGFGHKKEDCPTGSKL